MATAIDSSTALEKAGFRSFKCRCRRRSLRNRVSRQTSISSVEESSVFGLDGAVEGDGVGSASASGWDSSWVVFVAFCGGMRVKLSVNVWNSM